MNDITEPTRASRDDVATDATVNTVVRDATNGDQRRLQMIASLVNVFNFAVQIQTGRNNWNEHDTRAFGIALAAIDSIGSGNRDKDRFAKVADDVEAGIRDTIQHRKGTSR